MTLASWVLAGISTILLIGNIVGWIISFNRYSKNEARHIGRLEGKVDGLSTRMQSLEERMGNLDKRLDGFITNFPSDRSD